MPRRWSAALAIVAFVVLAIAAPAWAKSFSLPHADVAIELADDGSVLVTEEITFSFDGSFSGAYRDIPIRGGESIVDVSVSEGGSAYEPGGCVELGCSSPAGTFGTRDLGGRLRVVWHYEAVSEARTFTVSYRFLGLAKAYDDVVDVNLQVWGDEWEVGLARLDATFVHPGRDVVPLVWGHPSGVAGSTDPNGAGEGVPTLEASKIPAGQFVEFRVVVPRSVLSSTDGATIVPGDGRAEIVAEEEAAAAATEGRARLLAVLIVVAVLMAFLPAAAAAAVVWWRHGREPSVDYDREYEQEPPSDHPPAVIEGLLSQGKVDELGFTATVFDLIRRGVLGAQPVSVERSTSRSRWRTRPCHSPPTNAGS
jgi:uncharacterized membrane protein